MKRNLTFDFIICGLFAGLVTGNGGNQTFAAVLLIGTIHGSSETFIGAFKASPW
jgi:hypothetical protein